MSILPTLGCLIGVLTVASFAADIVVPEREALRTIVNLVK